MEKSNIININSNTSRFYQWTFEHVKALAITDEAAHLLTCIGLLLVAFMVLAGIDYLLRIFSDSILKKIIQRTKTDWDNILFKNRVQVHISRLILIGLAQRFLPSVFVGFPAFTNLLHTLLSVMVILAVYALVNSLLKGGRDILRSSKAFVDKPIDSYLQVLQIVLIFVVGTLLISVLTGNSPWSFFVSLGAASAVLMLVFKDTILGFVASVQVSANDSVRVGDWIEMPKYGVDGDIIQINLNNVRIQNWDKTIVTIPTYTLLSDSFKNYRGMQETGGRRIKRSINIKISTIRYLSQHEIDELKRIALLAPYIDKREKEIQAYNAANEVDQDVLVNGRRMTNIGLFRAYIKAYVDQNPHIHKGLTLLVRQLPPNEHGLPLELYMFTQGTQWAFFEDTMSDIFDHLFAAIKYFKLEIFELPASDDIRGLYPERLKSMHEKQC